MALEAHAAETIRAAAEVFVPGPPHDPTPGAADIAAELFITHYLDFVIPDLAAGVPAALDDIAAERADGRRFAQCSLDERRRLLDALESHEVDELRRLPSLLAFLAIAAVYGEWTGQDADGTVIRSPVGWTLTGFDGPSRGRRGLLHPGDA